MELYNYNAMINPHWEYRNYVISSMMDTNRSVIDMGCGSKNLLKYYNPSKYLGIDGIPYADVVVDLNSNFDLPGNWDYVVNSGILEFVERPDLYLEKIKKLGNQYFFSWWRGSGWGRMKFEEIEKLISINYRITNVINFGSTNRLYKCDTL